MPRTGRTTSTRIEPWSAQSDAMDFTAEDRAPEQALNEAIWQSVRGTDSIMPAARTSFRGAIHPGPASADDD